MLDRITLCDFVGHYTLLDIIGVIEYASQIGVIILRHDELLLIIVSAEGIAIVGCVVVWYPVPLRAVEAGVPFHDVTRVVPVPLVADDAQVVAVDDIPNIISIFRLQYITTNLVVSINSWRSRIKT